MRVFSTSAHDSWRKTAEISVESALMERNSHASVAHNIDVTGKMFAKYWVPEGLTAESDNVAVELSRRGNNSNDSFLSDRLAFLAGRLPLGEVSSGSFDTALRDTLSISAERSDEIASLAVGAFVEARFYSAP